MSVSNKRDGGSVRWIGCDVDKTSQRRPDFTLQDPAASVRLTSIVSRIVATLFLRPWLRTLWAIASSTLMAIAITTALRSAQPIWLQVVMVIVVIVLVYVAQFLKIRLV